MHVSPSETSVPHGFCGTVPMLSISFSGSLVGSLSTPSMWMFPKTLQHPCVPHTHAPTGNLMNSILNQHLMRRTRISIPGPNHPPVLSICLRASPVSSLEHISSPTCPEPQPVTKYTGWFKSKWAPSKSSNTIWFLPVQSDRELCVHTSSSSQLGGNEGSVGAAIAVSTTDSKNTTSHRCPLTQEVRAEHFGDYRNNHGSSFIKRFLLQIRIWPD